MNALPPRPKPKPWPMKWIVLVIAVFIAGYTWVNLRYRKPGRAFQPYEDMNREATIARLLAAGWQKMPVDARRPGEKPSTDVTTATINRAALGLGADLESKFAEKPKLLASIDRVVSPATVAHGRDYSAYFTASLGNLKEQVGDVTLYRKGNELVLVPTTEPLPGRDLKSRWNDSTYFVSFSTANLPPGRYEVRIVARGPAAEWTVTVR